MIPIFAADGTTGTIIFVYKATAQELAEMGDAEGKGLKFELPSSCHSQPGVGSPGTHLWIWSKTGFNETEWMHTHFHDVLLTYMRKVRAQLRAEEPNRPEEEVRTVLWQDGEAEAALAAEEVLQCCDDENLDCCKIAVNDTAN